VGSFLKSAVIALAICGSGNHYYCASSREFNDDWLRLFPGTSFGSN